MIDQYLFFSLDTTVPDLQHRFLVNLEKHYQNHSIEIDKDFISETMSGKMELNKDKFIRVAFRKASYAE